MATILYLTDFSYAAIGRDYYKEDLFLTAQLRNHFDLLIGHPKQAISFLHCADLVVFRNTGPVMGYKNYFNRFVATVKERGIITFNSFDGKADMKGKDYLLELTKEHQPVIPTIDSIEKINDLGESRQYVVKPKDGADSIGMHILDKEELWQANPSGKLIQPYLDFDYEVSFYYLDNQFQYALYAPEKTLRWGLETYSPTPPDLQFAETFIRWNNMQRGIVRVDGFRLKDGRLLLVELEDLNPYLSLDVLSVEKRDNFVGNFVEALKTALPSGETADAK